MSVKIPKNYEEYIEGEMLKCTYNAYNLLQTVGNFSISDTCRVVADWCREIKKYKCRIISFQKNSNKIFAKVKWIGSGADLSKKYGSLWSLDELYKV